MEQKVGVYLQSLSLRMRAGIALLLLVPVPSLGVLVGMYGIPGTALAHMVFIGAKVWILLVPVLWYRFVEGHHIVFKKISFHGIIPAVVSGCVMALVIIIFYWLTVFFNLDQGEVRTIIRTIGFVTPAMYAISALYWITVNSLAEEYIWRWFVGREVSFLFSLKYTAVISSLFFSLHHFIALSILFPLTLAIIGTCGVFVAGLVWSLLYIHYGSIWSVWVSHMIADIPIFVIGALLTF